MVYYPLRDVWWCGEMVCSQSMDVMDHNHRAFAGLQPCGGWVWHRQLLNLRLIAGSTLLDWS